jgi:hypothetical protein
MIKVRTRKSDDRMMFQVLKDAVLYVAHADRKVDVPLLHLPRSSLLVPALGLDSGI